MKHAPLKRAALLLPQSAALEAGASGYLLKDHLDEELSRALAVVGRGDTFLSVVLADAGLLHRQKSSR